MGKLAQFLGWEDPQSTPQAPLAPLPTQPNVDDSPSGLRDAAERMTREVNLMSGELPSIGIVLARRVIDAALAVVEQAERQHLDTMARLSIHSILADYLPTTLRAYVGASRAGHDDPAGLREQLTLMLISAEDVHAAIKRQDITALQAQDRFLRDKFSTSLSGSDLEL